LNEILITSVRVIDLRFPTSRDRIGSDAVNTDPDYSAAYCILETNSPLEGHGLTFTLGRGTDLVVQAVRYLSRYVVNRTLSSITEDLRAFARQLTDDSQFRWLGPEKGVIHLATGALLNAVWDLYARAENKPLWQLLADMEPAQLLKAADFRYIDDAISERSARHPERSAQQGPARTPHPPPAARLPCLHHLRRLVRLQRREDPRSRKRSPHRRLDPLQTQSRR
jgi:L-fuconate dehydratase